MSEVPSPAITTPGTDLLIVHADCPVGPWWAIGLTHIRCAGMRLVTAQFIVVAFVTITLIFVIASSVGTVLLPHVTAGWWVGHF